MNWEQKKKSLKSYFLKGIFNCLIDWIAACCMVWYRAVIWCKAHCIILLHIVVSHFIEYLLSVSIGDISTSYSLLSSASSLLSESDGGFWTELTMSSKVNVLLVCSALSMMTNSFHAPPTPGEILVQHHFPWTASYQLLVEAVNRDSCSRVRFL